MVTSPTSDPTSSGDDALQELLGRALQVADAPPPHVLDGARGAWAWRTIDAELAELVFDSASELTGVRDHSGSRQLTFRAAGLEIEVMVADPSTRRLVGQLVPAQPATVRLEGAADRFEADSDRFGRFSFDSVSTGPLRISVATGGGALVSTDWVLF